MYAKGKLLIIGGAEAIGDDDPLINKFDDNQLKRYEILSELLNATKNKRIEIITSGSRFQDEVKERYQRVFSDIGCPYFGFIQVENKMPSRNKKLLTRITEADTIFFTGGDQFRLATIIGGTPLVTHIREKYREDKDFTIAGTSAGAMVMSAIMITSGGKAEALIESDLQTSSGFGFIENCIIDTHFIKRGRFSRLAHAVVNHPDQLGIGLGEDTALIIKNGSEAECRGSGMVVIIDGNYIKQTNIYNSSSNEPVYVENLKVHLLVKGCRFSIKKRELYNPARSKLFKE